MKPAARTPVLSVVGSSGPIDAALADAAARVGALAMERGLRIVCGGRDGVMAALCKGARSSDAWTEGKIVGLLPGVELDDANAWLDFAIPTGLGIARNTLVVAAGDVVLALGGGAGTLSEIALAWQLGRPVVALDLGEGWAARLAGESLDERRADRIVSAGSAAEAIAIVEALLAPTTADADDLV